VLLLFDKPLYCDCGCADDSCNDGGASKGGGSSLPRAFHVTCQLRRTSTAAKAVAAKTGMLARAANFLQQASRATSL
jgi:hypothetical protein